MRLFFLRTRQSGVQNSTKLSTGLVVPNTLSLPHPWHNQQTIPMHQFLQQQQLCQTTSFTSTVYLPSSAMPPPVKLELFDTPVYFDPVLAESDLGLAWPGGC